MSNVKKELEQLGDIIREALSKSWTPESRETHEYKMNRTKGIIESAWHNDEECRVISVNFKTGKVISSHNASDLSGFKPQSELKSKSSSKKSSTGCKKKSKKAA